MDNIYQPVRHEKKMYCTICDKMINKSQIERHEKTKLHADNMMDK